MVQSFTCILHIDVMQGAIAKKPYNPILGETFKCYWDLPNGRRNAPDENTKVCRYIHERTTCIHVG